MYRKESEGWFKHTDFILIDMICLQVAFYLAYLIKGLGINPYNDLVYRNMAIVLELADLVTMFMLDMLHHVTQRGRYRELIATVGNVAAVGLLGSAYLFVMQEGEAYSRMTFGITLVLYFILSYTTRLAWKRVLASGKWDRNRRSLMIVTTKAEAKEVVETVKLNNYGKFLISGLVIVDKDMAGQSIAGVNVIANSKDAPMYVCQQWIDEVLIVVPDDKPYPEELIKKLEETGVTMHLGSKTQTKAQKQQENEIVTQIKSFADELKHSGTIDFILSDDVGTVVLSAQEQYLSNDNISEILGGHFKVLGKVIAICKDETENVDLLRKTTLSIFPIDQITEIFSGFQNSGIKQFNLPELKTQIPGPAVIVIPVAIYA